MKIGFSCGWLENYWGDWFAAKQYGGSEHIVVEVAVALAAQGHQVTVRLPYERPEMVHRGVRWVALSAPSEHFDLLFCMDDHNRRDLGDRTALVVCRSDPPPTTDFHQLIFLSKHHAKFCGHPDRPAVGGGVDLSLYRSALRRDRGHIICTSSPDRCRAAFDILPFFPKHTFTYKPVAGLPPTKQVAREELVTLQKKAAALIYPLDPVRPSDFFSMAVLEAMAAGTPVVVSDADSMPELWADAAIMIPRPVRVREWVDKVDNLIVNKPLWNTHSALGKTLAEQYDWPIVARRYLAAALGDN